MQTVNFQAPNDYSAEHAAIERQRRLAEALQAQSMQADQLPQTPAGGFTPVLSPLSGLAKALQGYASVYAQNQSDARQKALGQRYTSEGQNALVKGLQAYKGIPASTENIVDEQAAGGEGAPAQINAPAVAGSPEAAMGHWGSHPATQPYAAALLTQALKANEPYTLAPGAVRMGPNNQPLATAPFKPNAPQKPEAPHTRSIQRGDQKVYQEFDPLTRTWSDVPGASGPAFARQVAPVVNVGAGAPKARAPVGYRFSSDGETLEPIPGGPKDTSQPKPLPTAALKLQQAEVDAIGGASTINADLAAVRNQIETGKLKLSLANNLVGQARNFVGVSDENSRNLATFKATMERLRNESLRLNKGVQTEGDAVRAWNELFANINDSDVVKKRLDEIEKTNDRAINLRKLNIDNIRANYGAGPLDLSGQQNQPPAVGQAPQRRASDKPGSVLRFDAQGNPIP